MKKRRATFFLNKSCIRCGSTSNLELDHINPKEKVSHRIWSWTKVKQDVELAKCQVLCITCHKNKTKIDMAKPLTHGSVGYRRGCRCSICREYQINRMDKYHTLHPRKKTREHSSMVEL